MHDLLVSWHLDFLKWYSYLGGVLLLAIAELMAERRWLPIHELFRVLRPVAVALRYLGVLGHLHLAMGSLAADNQLTLHVWMDSLHEARWTLTHL